MNPQIREALRTATSLWFSEALAEIRQHPDQWAALRACHHEGRDVRIVWHSPSNDISVETTNPDGGRTEIFRDHGIADSSGFAWSETGAMQ